MASNQEWDTPPHGRLFLFPEENMVDVSNGLPHAGMPNDPRVGDDGSTPDIGEWMPFLLRQESLLL